MQGHQNRTWRNKEELSFTVLKTTMHAWALSPDAHEKEFFPGPQQQ